MIPDSFAVEMLITVLNSAKSNKFLIDGFPRNIAQAKMFESMYKEIDLIIYIKCDEELLFERLAYRGKDSNRPDDTPEVHRVRI